MISNKIQLITYPDSLGKDLKELKTILDRYFKTAIGGVHILPFYPSSGDRGFAPLTHLEIEKKFGNWNDLKAIGKKYDLVCDLILNHMSPKSKYFKDYLKNGSKSQYSKLFLTKEDVYKRPATIRSLNKIYRPRAAEPFVEFEFENKKKKTFWCTFSDEQIDLNWNSSVTRNLVEEFIKKLSENNVQMLRLDALGYIAKRRNTTCFLIPQVYRELTFLSNLARKYKIELLPEVHHSYKHQITLATRSNYSYDFVLPALLLYCLYTKDISKLKEWIRIRPHNFVNVLDTHDGIGIVDVELFMDQKEMDLVVKNLDEIGANKLKRNVGTYPNNEEIIYQMNCTYYDAVKRNEKHYLMLRAIQMFLPGIPQIYYVGALAGENDLKLYNKTKHGRDINRHKYNQSEIKKAQKRSVVKKLFKLMKFRNKYDAFNGRFFFEKTPEDKLTLKWEKNDLETTLDINFKTNHFKITYQDEKTKEIKKLI